MESKLGLNFELVDQARASAAKVADDVQHFIDQHTTVTVERAVCRLLGIDGVNDMDVPLPNVVVDHLMANSLLPVGTAWAIGNAMVETGKDPQAIAEDVAADKLLIPIQCEFYALEGVTKLLDSMKRVKTRLNPSLDIFGVLLTMYDGRTTLSKQVVEEVRNYFGKIVFDTLIPRTVKLSEAPSFGQPITQYDPSGKGAQSYVDLAKEVINRG